MIRTALASIIGFGLSLAPAMSATFNAEVDFVTRAATAEIVAIAESQLAIDRTHNPKIKTFAQRMIQDQRAAEAALQASAAGSGATVPTKLNPVNQADVTALRGASGAKFDKAYAAAQVAIYSNALTLYADYMLLGDDAKLKDLATKMIPIVQAQLNDAVALAGD